MNAHRFPLAAALLAGCLAAGAADTPATGWGSPGEAKAARRTVRITLADHRVAPAIVEVGHNETVRFEVHNAGQVKHALAIGTPEALRQQADRALKHPGAAREQAWLVSVDPGKTASLAWQFTRTGEFAFGCILDGHYPAGMGGRIRVVEPAGHRH